MNFVNGVYLPGAVRTPIGSFCGAFENTPAPALGSVAAKAALARSRVPADQVDEVIFGNVVSAGLGQNVARQVAIGSGLAPSETHPRPRWAAWPRKRRWRALAFTLPNAGA